MPITRETKQDIETHILSCMDTEEYMKKISSVVVKEVTAKMQQMFEVFKTQIEELTNEIKKLKSEKTEIEELNKKLEVSNKNYEVQIAQLTERSDMLEQYTRRNNLRIFGISEGKDEDCEGKALEIINRKLELNMTREQICRVHRTGKIKSNKPRGIIIKFVSYKQRSLVFQNKKKLKGSGIIITEDLTKNRLSLYKTACDVYGPRNTWSKDGCILVNFEGTIKRINNPSDIKVMPKN